MQYYRWIGRFSKDGIGTIVTLKVHVVNGRFSGAVIVYKVNEMLIDGWTLVKGSLIPINNRRL